MNFIIKAIAALIARRIERGSRVGALVGTILGIGIGLGVWIWTHAASNLSPSFIIVFAIPLAIIGALLGSTTGGRNPRPLDDSLLLQTRIRITDFNNALIPPLMFILFSGCTIVACVAIGTGEARGIEGAGLGLLVFALAAVSGFTSSRVVFWVDLSNVIKIQRIFRHRIYDPSTIQAWTVAAAADHPTSGELIIHFDDGFKLEFPVTGSKIPLVTARLVELAPDKVTTATGPR